MEYQISSYILGKNKEIETLFEIKTDATVKSCYEVIGQLLFHSSKLSVKPFLRAVFPHTLAKEYKDILEKLGFSVLTYRWIENQPRFSNFNLT